MQAGKKAPKCRKTLVFHECDDKAAPVKSVANKKALPKPVPVTAPKRAPKVVNVTKRKLPPTAQKTTSANKNDTAKMMCKPLHSQRSRKSSQNQVTAIKAHSQKVQNRIQKLVDSKKPNTKASMQGKEQKKDKAPSRRSGSNKKLALPSQTKAAPNSEKKREGAIACPGLNPISSCNKRESSSLNSSLDDSVSDSSEDSGVMIEDSSDSDDFGDLSDSSDEDLSPTSQASSNKAKKISFTQHGTPGRCDRNI